MYLHQKDKAPIALDGLYDLLDRVGGTKGTVLFFYPKTLPKAVIPNRRNLAHCMVILWRTVLA